MKNGKFMTRREALKLLACAPPSLALARALRAVAPAKQDSPGVETGPFTGTRESLQTYRCPDWFRDAKLGIWAHWGPQSAPEDGDWYGRNMYVQGSAQYEHHLKHYGHPSKFGYKDIIPTWKGDLLDPEHLVGLYRKAGAKYFVSMGVHVDNFDLWNSKFTRWNAVNMGVKKDVVSLFGAAARAHGLRFGVSDHLWCAYKWFSVAHGSDSRGSRAGVPYDGANPRYADLYGDCPRVYRELPWNEDGIPEQWKRHWFARIQDLIDQSEPDYVYSDGQIPFGDWGVELVTHFYNRNAQRHDGRVEAVFTSKREEDTAAGTCVFDKERGLVDGIRPEPWQADTCIGHWHYDRNVRYKSPKRIIDMLVDVVSRNGNLLLNFPLNNRGVLDGEECRILASITEWMAINGEAIHGTRPWKIFGDGPTVQKPDPNQKYDETNRRDLTADDLRFTTRGDTLYAFFMGWPEKREIVIAPLATARPQTLGRIQGVNLLGHDGRLRWKHDEKGLVVRLPAERPCDFACVLRIEGMET